MSAGVFGQVDVLVNAGITQPVKTMDITPADLQRILDVNLSGVLYLSQAFIPPMRERKQGSIACMSSVSAQRGGGIFRRPALLRRQGRRAGSRQGHGARAQAGRHSGELRDTRPDRDRHHRRKLTDEMRQEILKGIPLRRLSNAKDVAGIYLFLASDLSAYVTGAVIDVNGGMLIHG